MHVKHYGIIPWQVTPNMYCKGKYY